ncbi:TcmI family type II polyketide cyclase [Micromonospora inositola]|uniref:Polyketide synthesis cyclase n=1 Tax=Micromonospora inositola TaxID=47865 RepID=A0A1C5J8Y9_9ACTN|nr:TcmI family type II polyketide cyclase [Micromonospora inositola]SCG66711.1 Polyketide synthesis cyclase [Micromonospora inositola]
MVFRNVIVCHMVPGSDGIVGDVFGHYDKTTRPQDLGVIGRRLLTLDDLYIHVIERVADPKLTGQTRGLPAFQKIAEVIGPYVTPYPKNWQNPSDSVAKEFYRWVPADPAPESAGRNLTVIVGRIKPGAEPDVARIFGESDAGSLPVQLGVTGRWLYSIDDLYVHLLERTDAALADASGQDHDQAAFAKIMAELSPFISPYNPDAWRGPEDAVAREFYRWRADS